jgi:hypothetical protein
MIGRPPEQPYKSNTFGGRAGCALAAAVATLLLVAWVAPLRAQLPGYLATAQPAAEGPAGVPAPGVSLGGFSFAETPMMGAAWPVAGAPQEAPRDAAAADAPPGAGPLAPPSPAWQLSPSRAACAAGAPCEAWSCTVPGWPAVPDAVSGPPPPEVWPPAEGDLSAPPLVSAGPSRVRRLLDCLDVDCVVRGYYSNDQRVAWSGMEATFGAEAALDGKLVERVGECQITVEGEFYLNEPFAQNMLLNTPERQSYAADFRVDTFEISKLSLTLTYGNFSMVVGKMETPFGRTYFPLYSNARLDAPYIRTEAIGWRETGILLRYRAGLFAGDVALTNGGENCDTNSSKALVARLGLETGHSAIGCSIKAQDGVGSEEDKEFNNQLGADAMLRFGPLVLSSEFIYDEYGFFRPGFDPDDIYWYRSIYYRDESSGTRAPLTGLGYYVNLGYEQDRWNATLNFGQFHPIYVGTAPDQRDQLRGIVKLAYRFAKSLQGYSVVMIENGGYIAQANRPRKGLVLLEGLQYTF